jgi:hypothetical protein
MTAERTSDAGETSIGKRSDFKRIERDNYPTPAAAVEPLFPWLPPRTQFVEPCVGEGILAGHLKRAGHILVDAYDLPDDARVKRYDVPAGAIFCTNPPYWGRSRDLHRLIVNLSSQAPVWLLMSADWLFNQSSGLMMPRLLMVVAIGRVQWIAGSEHSGMENAAWLLFDRPSPWATIRLIGRAPRESEALLFAAE